MFAGQLRLALAGLPKSEQDAAFAQQIHSLHLVVAEDWPAIEAMLQREEDASPDQVAQGMIYYRGWLHTLLRTIPRRIG